MTKEEKRTLNPEVVFVSRELGIPKKWLWYFLENDLETFSKIADFAEAKSEGLVGILALAPAMAHCLTAYVYLRKLTNDIKWIADAYKADKKEPFPAGLFEEYYLEKLAKEKKENDRK